MPAHPSSNMSHPDPAPPMLLQKLWRSLGAPGLLAHIPLADQKGQIGSHQASLASVRTEPCIGLGGALEVPTPYQMQPLGSSCGGGYLGEG